MAAGAYPHSPPGYYSPGCVRRDSLPADVFRPTFTSQLLTPEAWRLELGSRANLKVNSIISAHAIVIGQLVNERMLDSDQYLKMKVCDAFFHFFRWKAVHNPIKVAFEPVEGIKQSSRLIIKIPETFRNAYVTTITANLLYENSVKEIEQYEDLAEQIDRSVDLDCEEPMTQEAAFALFNDKEMDGAAACYLVIKDCMVHKRHNEAIRFVSSLKNTNLHKGAASTLSFYLAQEHTWRIDTYTPFAEYTEKSMKDFLVDFQSDRLSQFQIPAPEVWERELRSEANFMISSISSEYVKWMERAVRESKEKNERVILRVYNAFYNFFRWKTKLDPLMVAFDPFYLDVIPEKDRICYITVITANLLYGDTIQESDQYERLAKEIDRIAIEHCSDEMKSEIAYEHFHHYRMDGASACALVIRDCLDKKRIWEAIHFVSSLTKVNLKRGAANFLAHFLTQEYEWELDQLKMITDQVMRAHMIRYKCKQFSSLNDIDRLKEYSYEAI